MILDFILTTEKYPLSFSGSPCDVSDNRGWFPLHEAAAAGQTGCLRSLLEHKSEDIINSKAYSGETALFLAAVSGHAECVKALMDFGADVNIMNDEEVSLLVAAVKGGNLECFQVCFLCDSVLFKLIFDMQILQHNNYK